MRPQDCTDRTIHAEDDACEVVRYDRSGKYYLELKNGSRRRAAIDFSQAVAYALKPKVKIHYGRPGGTAFDAACLREVSRSSQGGDAG